MTSSAYMHPGQPTKLRNILVLALASGLIFGEFIEIERTQYQAFEREISWIREVAPIGDRQNSQGGVITLSAVLIDPIWFSKFPDLIERISESSSILADHNELVEYAVSQLVNVLFIILIVAGIATVLQSALASSGVRGAQIVLPALYIVAMSLVLFSTIITLQNAGARFSS